MLEKNHLLIFNWFYDVSAGSNIAPGRHKALIRVLTGGNPDAAAIEMGRHVRSGIEEIQEGIAVRFGKLLASLKRVSLDAGPNPTDTLGAWRSSYARRTGTSNRE
jgi:hypothetical protein